MERLCRSLFLLNKASMLEKLLSVEMIFDVVGALEYNVFLPDRIAHREFLKNGCRLVEVTDDIV